MQSAFSDKVLIPYCLLGIEMYPMTANECNNLVDYIIKKKPAKKIIQSQNLHTVYMYHTVPFMKKFYQNAYVHIDGMPLVWWGKMLGYPLRIEQRVTWVDYIDVLIRYIVQNNLKLFYIGSTEQIAATAVTKLCSTYKNLQINYMHGYFNKNPDSSENSHVLQMISSHSTDVLLVGMGTPVQEQWIYDNIDRIDAKVIMTCGAVMEFMSGLVPTPPRWMGKIGLEWLFRFLDNPRRFWCRYFIEPWYLVPYMASDVFSRLIKRNGTQSKV